MVYIPESNFGAKNPKFKGEVCHGKNLSDEPWLHKVNLEWLLDAYQKTPDDKEFFGKTFTIHAGNENLRKQIESGMSAQEISKTWEPELEKFKLIREKYLLYPE